MNRWTIACTSLLTLASLTAPAAARQDRPPPPDEPQRRMRGNPREPGAPDGPGGPTFQGEVQVRMREEAMRFDMMRGYIELVDRIARLSRDPTTAGVAAVISAADLLKPRGADAGIDYFTKMLDSAKNDAVKRAIRMQLIELYKQSGQQDKAMEQLSELINAAPAGGSSEPREQQPPPPGR